MSSEENSTNVTFFVSADSGELSGATVDLPGYGSQVTQGGNAVFLGVAPGNYSVTVSKEGYATFNENRSIAAVAAEIIRIQLQANSGI